MIASAARQSIQEQNFWVIAHAYIQLYQILPNRFLTCYANLHSHWQPGRVPISLPAVGIERFLHLSHLGGGIMLLF